MMIIITIADSENFGYACSGHIKIQKLLSNEVQRTDLLDKF